MINITTAVACSTMVSPTKGVTTLISYMADTSLLKSFIIMVCVLVIAGVYFVHKYNIKIKFPLFKNKKLDAMQKQINDLTNDAVTRLEFVKLYETFIINKEQIEKQIQYLKEIYVTEVERDTDLIVTKALEYLEKWFFDKINKNKTYNLSERCDTCKTISFLSCLENVGVDMKEEFRIAFDRNGFLHADDMEFTEYIKNLEATFRKTIRTSLRRFYVIPDEIDEYFKMSPPDPEFQEMMTHIYEAIHTIIHTVKDKELKLLKRVGELEDELKHERVELSKVLK